VISSSLEGEKGRRPSVAAAGREAQGEPSYSITETRLGASPPSPQAARFL